MAIKEIDADLCDYEIDAATTEELCAEIRASRVGLARTD